MKLDYLIIHCSASPEGRKLGRPELEIIHKAPRYENLKYYYMGYTYRKIEELPKADKLGGQSIRLLAMKGLFGRGWKQFGYSDFIHIDGRLENLVPYDTDGEVQPREQTNGALGLNGKARHVMYVGGMNTSNTRPKDTRTPEQLITLRKYIKDFLRLHPDAKVGGHNQFAYKACPSFDVPKWLRALEVPERNICTEKTRYDFSKP